MKNGSRCNVLFLFALCALTANSKGLNLIYPDRADAEGAQKSVDVTFDLQGDVLHAHFTVISPNNFTLDAFRPGDGPYVADVVEVFVAPQKNGGVARPYYEFEVSPLNQTLIVKIDENKVFHEGFVTPFTHSVKMTDEPKGWTADLSIPLLPLKWNNDPATIVANAFAILGQPHHRHYWSLFLPKQDHPNFHVPEAFQPILQLEPEE